MYVRCASRYKFIYFYCVQQMSALGSISNAKGNINEYLDSKEKESGRRQQPFQTYIENKRRLIKIYTNIRLGIVLLLYYFDILLFLLSIGKKHCAKLIKKHIWSNTFIKYRFMLHGQY